ncbi:pyrroloquinoline quinone precursor peptide PqqA [Kushneria aurantia]|uniref:Coenzyme PQQ synthesis protein A n=1 Tax=Kushneria aurantia TaxID=504092 RepID=A0ABV6G2H2_9GAMM
MSWSAPEVTEISAGMEVSVYLPAEI